MDTKKLSFGFSKVQKKTNLVPIGKKIEDSNSKKDKGDGQIELIKCLENSSIKLIKEKLAEKPLVIQMRDPKKTSSALASLEKRKKVLEGVEDGSETKTKVTPLLTSQDIETSTIDTIEKQAIRELLSEAQVDSNSNEPTNSTLVLSMKADELPLDGAEEPTLGDYENIPIQQYGLAMLRGMGWKDDTNSRNKKSTLDDGPVQRPKGMGLGADKAVKKKELLVQPEQNEILEIKKGAFVRILAGKRKNLYAQIEGLDDHAGRVIIKLAVGGEKESLNEFLVQPVSKAEYQTYGKVINAAKYEEYKKHDSERGELIKYSEEKIKIEKELKKEKYYDPTVKQEPTSSSNRLKFESQNIKQEVKNDRDYLKSDTKESKRIDNKHKSIEEYSMRDKRAIDSKSSSRPHSPESHRSRRKSKSPRQRRQSCQSSSESSDRDNRHHHKAKKTKKRSNKPKKYYRNDSSEDEKKHKKKTKKSKRERSRSRSRSRGRR